MLLIVEPGEPRQRSNAVRYWGDEGNLFIFVCHHRRDGKSSCGVTGRK